MFGATGIDNVNTLSSKLLVTSAIIFQSSPLKIHSHALWRAGQQREFKTKSVADWNLEC